MRNENAGTILLGRSLSARQNSRMIQQTDDCLPFSMCHIPHSEIHPPHSIHSSTSATVTLNTSSTVVAPLRILRMPYSRMGR